MFLFQQDPVVRVVVCDFFSKFAGSCAIHAALHNLMKVFSLLSLQENLTVFNETRITTALIICIGIRSHVLPTTGVGSCNRLFVSGFVRAFLQINESQLHTFCFITNHHAGSWAWYPKT